MGFPFGQELFRTLPEFIATYQFSDISEGIGYNLYYGSRSNAGANLASPIQGESALQHIRGASVSFSDTAYTELLNEDFDITFNLPQRIKGKLIVNVPIGLWAITNNSFFFRATVQAFHYNGSTETQLGSDASSFGYESVGGIDKITSKMTSVSINITTARHFKKGETLRITIKVEGKNLSSTGSVNGGIGCDPQNGADTSQDFEGSTGNNEENIISIGGAGESGDEDTQLTFQVPFVLDLP